MSTDRDHSRREDRGPPVNILLSLGEDGEMWIARDEDTGVTSQGRTRQTALANLDDALAGYRGEGEPPTDEDLRQLGIDPNRNISGSIDEADMFE